MADFDNMDVVRLGFVQTFNAVSDIVNVVHVQIASGGGLAAAAAYQDFAEYADDLYDIIDTGLSDLMLPKHISVKNVTQDTVWGNIAWGSYTGGINASEPVAPQVALLCWGRTSISRVQIRKYLGVFCEGDMTDGLWVSGVRALADAYMVYHIAQQTMGNGLVLQGCAYSVALDRVTLANSVSTSGEPVIQRRRRQGRGS